MIQLKLREEVAILKESGAILASILAELSDMAKEGVTLNELDKHARKRSKDFDAHPTFLGYKPDGASKAFPAALCTSLNEVVVHGVPNQRVLQKGDVLKIDMGITYQGMITDSATTVVIGGTSKEVYNLIDATKRALEEAIDVSLVGARLGDIGYVIAQTAQKAGVKVLKDLTGHGVGYELHEDPVVWNVGKKGEGEILREGMVIAIEPMFALSSSAIIQRDDDSYAVQDGSMSAHFEHSIAITKEGPIVLTA
jgi:methionyl aminopeptidase